MKKLMNLNKSGNVKILEEIEQKYNLEVSSNSDSDKGTVNVVKSMRSFIDSIIKSTVLKVSKKQRNLGM